MTLHARLTIADLADLIGEAAALQFAEDLAGGRPVTAADVVDFLQIQTGDAFDVAPDDAIASFKAKKLKPTFSYADMLGDAHAQSFTVAKMMDVDMLGQVRTSLEAAMANGTPFKEWADGLMPMLQASGWWGRKEVIDPVSGKTIVAQLGSPHRLETVFRTNMQMAYAEQQWQVIDSQKDVAPYLMYDAVDDFRTRPAHKARDGTILPVGHHWWDKNTPPLGYNCRCGVIQLTEADVEAMGKQPNVRPPALGTYEWTNPRTGKVQTFPDGVDPGFDYNVGKFSVQKKLNSLLSEKLKTLPPDMQTAAFEALMKAPLTKKSIDAAVSAQNAIAEAKASAAIERAAAKAAELAKQAEAKKAIQAIADSPAKGATLWTKKAYEQLLKTPGFKNGTPSEQLDVIHAKAKQLSAKNQLAGTLSAYKAKILEGKTPTPAQKKALDSLAPDEKDAFLAKVDAEVQAVKAKKQAEASAALGKAVIDEAPVPKPSVEAKLVSGEGPSVGNLTQIGPQRGSNPGGLYQDTTTGVKWYVKSPASEDVAWNEVLAAKLYELAGVDVPELHVIRFNGKVSVASRIVDGLEKAEASVLAKSAGAADGFVVDAWLANWDVVGMGYDNLLMRGSRAFRVDTGGALRYRAQGGLKGQAFGDTVTELDSLRDPRTNAQAASVFGKLSKSKIESSAERVLAISDDDIKAVVDKYGPGDAVEREALAARLIARKKDIASRYPRAAEAEAPAPVAGTQGRVTAAEQKLIEDSRINGYGIKTDRDAIEDHMVVVSTYLDKAGADMTRGWLKLRPDAAAQLLAKVREGAGSGPVVELSGYRQAVLEAVKGINMRASKGEAFSAKDVTRIKAARYSASEAVAQLKKAAGEAAPGPAKASLQTQLNIWQDWAEKLDDMGALVKDGAKAKGFTGVFPVTDIPDMIEYTTPAMNKPQVGLGWKKGGPQMAVDVAAISKGTARLTGGKQVIPGVSEHYYANTPDGGRVFFIPDNDRSAFAMRGTLIIDTPGKSVTSSGRIFEHMDDLGINVERATDLDRDNLYLNAFARLALASRPQQWDEWQKIDRNLKGADSVQQKLAYLKTATGTDIEKTDGWKTRAGVYQAFGHGRAYQFRPDLNTPEFRKFADSHLVYHNPISLSKSGGSAGVWEALKPVIEGGGVMASLSDRVRRGVQLNGSSVGADFSTGGASYFFTRIKSRSAGLSSGLYWKADVLKRMDAISYDGDNFGRVTPGHIESNRRGQSVADFKDMAGRGSDETIFKNGISVFDDLEMVVFKTKTERDRAIAEIKAMGYNEWPDGRKLTDVFKSEAEAK